MAFAAIALRNCLPASETIFTQRMRGNPCEYAQAQDPEGVPCRLQAVHIPGILWR